MRVVPQFVEALLPVHAFLGFAAGAAGLLLLAGPGTGAGGTLLLFAVRSGLAYAGLRLALGRAQGRARVVTRDINET